MLTGISDDKYVEVLNCKFLNICKDELLDKFNYGVLMPTNVDMVIKLQRDKEFVRCFQDAEFKVNDSQVIKFAARFLGRPLKSTISGSDFFPQFYTFHRNNPDVRIYLLGAEEGVAQKAMEKINAKIGRDIIVGCYSPRFGFERDAKECEAIIERINQSGATVLAVGMGAPKQEKWIFKYKNWMPGITRFMCLGATIDFEAGKIKRAPEFFRKIGIEWLFRLTKEPKRLWKRYLVDDMPFLWLILKQKVGYYRNPLKDQVG